MNTSAVDQSRKRLDFLFEKGRELLNDPELQSHWSRYLCVLVSGFLETSLQTLYYEYAKDKAAPFVANYVDVQIGRFQNPNMDRILALTQSFSPDWASALRNATDGELKTRLIALSRTGIKLLTANQLRFPSRESVNTTRMHVRLLT